MHDLQVSARGTRNVLYFDRCLFLSLLTGMKSSACLDQGGVNAAIENVDYYSSVPGT